MFEKGDRVICEYHRHSDLIGMSGIICDIRNSSVLVRFDYHPRLQKLTLEKVLNLYILESNLKKLELEFVDPDKENWWED